MNRTKLILWLTASVVSVFMACAVFADDQGSQEGQLDTRELDFSLADVRYLSSDKNAFNAEQLIEKNFEGFKALDSPDQNFGYSDKDYWILIRFPDPAGDMEIYVEIAYSLLDEVDAFYLSRQNTVGQTYATGDHRVFGSRPIATTNFVFPLRIGATAQTSAVLLRIHSSGSIYIPIRFWKPETYLIEKSNTMLIQGLFFGAILAVLLYNFFICILTRSRTYFYYIGLVFSIAQVYMVLRGYSFQYLWPNLPKLVDLNVMVAAACSEGFIVAFSAQFLKLNRSSRIFYRIAVYLSALYFFLAFLAFFMPYGKFVKIIVIMAPVSVMFSMSMGIRSLFLGKREAYYYVIAWTIFIIGTVLYSLANFGIIPSNPLTTHAMQIGSAFEIMFLSFALGARLNNLQNQNKSLILQLRQYINKIEIIVAEKTESIRSIMKHIKLGIFTIRMPGMVFGDEFSQHMRSIFGSEPKPGENAFEYLLRQSDVNRDSRSALEQASYAVSLEEALAFELNQHCFIKSMKVQSSTDAEKFLEIDWNPMFNEEGQVDRLLVTCKDVTELNVYRQKAGERLKDLDIIAELLSVPADRMRTFFDMYDDFLLESGQRLGFASSWTQDEKRNFIIELHTLKGAARSLGLRDLAEKVHDLETLFSAERTHSTIHQGPLESSFDMISISYRKYRTTNYETLNRRQKELDNLDVKRKDLEAGLELLHAIINLNLPSETHKRITMFIEHLKEHLYISTERLFQEILDPLSKIAKELNKPLPKVLGTRELVYFRSEEATALRQAFTHILRNAMDHGIEAAPQRIESGKEPFGTITIDLRHDQQHIEIHISDDGQGLNLQRIKERALQNGLFNLGQTYRPQDLAELIFQSGLSTSQQLTLTSGRGVGMGAIRKHLEDIGADIGIELGNESREGSGAYAFRFVIRLPREPRHLVSSSPTSAHAS